MKCAVTAAPGRMEIRDEPEPTPTRGEATICVEAVGICGSDYNLFVGRHPYSRFPQRQGHEFVGTISAFGPGYEGDLSVGLRVAVEPLIACGDCYPCRRGRYNCCQVLKVMGVHVPGGLAQQVAVPTNALYPVGDLEPGIAVLAEPLAVAMQAITRARVTPQDRVAVLGAGPIGLAALLSCIDRGASVLVADRIPERLERARSMGAEATVDTSLADLDSAVADFTSGDGAAVVIEATGAPAMLRRSFDIAAYAGRIVIVGISDRAASIPVIEFSRKELDVLGSRNSARIFPSAISLIAAHPDKAAAMVTHNFTLAQTAEAIEYASTHPRSLNKAVIHIDATA